MVIHSQSRSVDSIKSEAAHRQNSLDSSIDHLKLPCQPCGTRLFRALPAGTGPTTPPFACFSTFPQDSPATAFSFSRPSPTPHTALLPAPTSAQPTPTAANQQPVRRIASHRNSIHPHACRAQPTIWTRHGLPWTRQIDTGSASFVEFAGPTPGRHVPSVRRPDDAPATILARPSLARRNSRPLVVSHRARTNRLLTPRSALLDGFATRIILGSRRHHPTQHSKPASRLKPTETWLLYSLRARFTFRALVYPACPPT